MKKILYVECNSGISGDMTVAALLDLGVPADYLKEAIASLPLEGYELVISKVNKSGLVMTDFDVRLDAAFENHDHDMSYLHGHDHEHTHSHSHEDDHDHKHSHSHSHEDGHDHEHSHSHSHEDDHEHAHSHTHEDGHPHEHSHSHEADHVHAHSHTHEDGHEHVHHHEHRGLPEIISILEKGKLTQGALKLAKDIFHILAEAEAKVHGKSLEEVHFHEVGAVDSIVDIAAAAVCLDWLGADEIIVSPLSEGHGTIRCQHGIIPVPVPAVSQIVMNHGLDLRVTGVHGELVTPTGAAIVAATRDGSRLPENYRLKALGMGAGKRHYEGAPGFLRVMLVETEETGQMDVNLKQEAAQRDVKRKQETGQMDVNLKQETAQRDVNRKQEAGHRDVIWKLETNLDDSTGECLGYLMERLLKAGARDVSYSPVFMKKNRPGYQLNVICDEATREELEGIIFQESTTIGIRRSEWERTVLERSFRKVETAYGILTVKVCSKGNLVKYYPEYEEAAAAARAYGVSLQTVYQEIQNCLSDR